jgi:hypothetical protein
MFLLRARAARQAGWTYHAGICKDDQQYNRKDPVENIQDGNSNIAVRSAT